MSLILEGTAACKMRDALISARYAGQITPKQVTEKLSKVDMPDWLEAQILQMTAHNQYKRITCPIELAMEAAVHYKIVCRLIEEDRNK